MLRRREFIPSLGFAALAATRVQVIAHRGEHLENPENSIAGIEAAIALGCDWVEIDVRTTKDEHFVLMHDSTVNRTTKGNGAVTDLTLSELRAFGVPTLEEALTAMHGRIGVYFDAKQIAAPAIVAALKNHAMMERALVYGGLPLLKEINALGYPQLAMPEAVSVENVQRILRELNPRVIAFDRRDFIAPVIGLARNTGKGIFVDRLGADDTVPSWRAAIEMGATAIQTDHPADLIALLRSSGH